MRVHDAVAMQLTAKADIPKALSQVFYRSLPPLKVSKKEMATASGFTGIPVLCIPCSCSPNHVSNPSLRIADTTMRFHDFLRHPKVWLLCGTYIVIRVCAALDSVRFSADLFVNRAVVETCARRLFFTPTSSILRGNAVSWAGPGVIVLNYVKISTSENVLLEDRKSVV